MLQIYIQFYYSHLRQVYNCLTIFGIIELHKNSTFGASCELQGLYSRFNSESAMGNYTFGMRETSKQSIKRPL